MNLVFYALFSGKKDYNDLPEEEKAKPEIYAMDDAGNPFSPGWFTLNCKASFPISTNVTVFSGIENLADKRYRPYSSGMVAPGRNFVLSLKATF